MDTLHCSRCGRQYAASDAPWRCPCGGALSLPPGPGLTRADVLEDEPSLWRYARALPLGRDDAAAYFGEGLTPLVERQWGGARVHFKLDYLFPSGSYKDRGSAVLVNMLRRRGVRAVHEDSSGNAGASLAAYCAAAGLDCTIYVPASTSAGKRVQIAAHGARLVEVPGPREAAALAAIEAAESGASHYASHNWDPYFVEGVKTVAFELWEQWGYAAPAAVFAPLGYGSVVLGLARGFAELVRAGAVPAMPRIFGCQAAACAPFVRAFQEGDPELAVLGADEVSPTLAEGIAASRPMRAREVLRAITASNGRVLAVDEAAIQSAWRDLCAAGLYVEPTSAVAPAAARSVIASGELSGSDVAVILTGAGLKSTATLGRLLAA
ncbi:MAG TPA: pyridoxal-phosphate dependent enzyme [Longimicrobiales bacterium]|nr:pyridoxal-phosphate dependent enzyme [Longimicrobiales bacterium]